MNRLIGLLGLACALLPRAGRADNALQPIHLRIGGQEVAVKDPALANDREIYVPLDMLSAVGAKGRLNAHADAVLVTWTAHPKPEEIAVARPNGRRMIALSDLAHLLRASIVRTERKDEDGNPIPGSKGDTVYLLARITDVYYADGALHVATSFPVPFHAHMADAAQSGQGYLDCIGSTMPADLHPAPIPATEKRASHLVARQYSIDTARIAVDLARNAELRDLAGVVPVEGVAVALSRRADRTPAQRGADRTGDASGRHEDRTIARADSTAGTPTGPRRRGTGDAERAEKPGHADRDTATAEQDTEGQDQGERVGIQRAHGLPDDGKPGFDNRPDGKTGSDPGNARPNGNRGTQAGPPNTDAGDDDNADRPDSDVPDAPSANRGALPSRNLNFQRGGIIEVRGVAFVVDDETSAHVVISTSGRAGNSVHYLDNGKLAIDIPNAMLHLPDPDQGQQTFTHPLLTGLHAELLRETPPLTRITLDTPRVVGFTVNTSGDRVSLDIRMPRNSGGILADKVIVVDAGHGGSSSGATFAGIQEKNITLAISLKLRACLEAAGAKVVMTRDRDATVPLYDRPHLANAINADLFVSVHNDDTERTNSASGTSSYYHKGDASSRALAICVQREIVAVSGLPSRGALSDGILYSSGLAVLRCSSMPAVLVEVAYINNTRDRRKLVNDDFQQQVAQAICDGLRHYVEGTPETVRHSPSSAGIQGTTGAGAQPLAHLGTR